MTHPQLKRLKIHRYEQFVDVPWIEFSPHENVILGINGAGKTRLLALLEAVLSFDYRAFLRDEIDVEFELAYAYYGLEGGTVTARGRVICRGGKASALAQPGHSPRLGADDGATHLSSKLEMRGVDSVVTMEINGLEVVVHLDGAVVNETWRVLPGRAWPFGKGELGRELSPFFPAIEALHISPDDREFIRLTEAAKYTLGARDLQISVDVDTGSEVSIIFGLMQNWARLSAHERESGLHLDRNSSQATEGLSSREVLPGLLDAIAGRSLTVRPQIVRESASTLECEGVELRLRFTSGVEVRDSGLTFGQRRFLMIALLVLFDELSPLMIDEVDNGLHPRLLESVFKLLPGRQSFLVSHNKSVVDLLNYESAEDLRQRIHVCRRDEAGNQTVDTLDEATAQEVFEKISVGIMHPSDVLLVEGLW